MPECQSGVDIKKRTIPKRQHKGERVEREIQTMTQQPTPKKLPMCSPPTLKKKSQDGIKTKTNSSTNRPP
jgi:hypothetical protein